MEFGFYFGWDWIESMGWERVDSIGWKVRINETNG